MNLPIRRRRAMTIPALGLVAALTLAGCGIPLDRAAHDVAEQDRKPPTGQAVAPAQGGGAASPKVYFVSDQGTQERLEAVSRDVAPDAADPVLSELLKGLTSEELARRLHTFIPSDTQLLGTDARPDGILDVNLSNSFFEAKAEDGIKAVAQIVYTACQLPGVKQVRLLIQGQPREWPRGDGVNVAQPLTPFDYPELNPSSQPDYPPQPAVVAPTTTTGP